MDFIFLVFGCLWNVFWFILIRKLLYCKLWGLIRDFESILLNFSFLDIWVFKGYLGFFVKLFVVLEYIDNIFDCDLIKNYYFRVKIILINRII